MPMAHSKVIVYGNGPEARECIESLGREHIHLVVHELCPPIEGDFHGCPLRHCSALPEALASLSKTERSLCDIVVAVDKGDLWWNLRTANKLARLGCAVSLWHDIKKRWPCARDFLTRDRSIYPHEHESTLEIKSAQLDYFYKHVTPSTLSPATGPFREKQLFCVEQCVRLFSMIDDDTFKPVMCFGTLIGALRHKGFIPWDDDLDFALPIDPYLRLMEKLEQLPEVQVFYHDGYAKQGDNVQAVFTTRQGGQMLDQAVPYYCRIGYGFLSIHANTGAAALLDNKTVCDIFPLYHFDDAYSVADYQQDIENYRKRRSTDLVATDRAYLQEMRDKGIIVASGNKLGFGHTHVTSIMHWYHGCLRFREFTDCETLYPPHQMRFESATFWAPAKIEAFLNFLGYPGWRGLPSTLPFDHHDRTRADSFASISAFASEVCRQKG